MRNYIRSITDMEKLYYSPVGAKYIAKADAPVLTTTTGVYNAIYGAQVWAQLNQEANVFGVLPKTPWTRSGWRVITARAATSGGGVAENGTLPDTLKPTFQEISTKPKTVAHTFDVSEVQQFLAEESEDDAIGGMEMMRSLMGIHHKEMMNVMLMTNVTTVASNNLESVDRVASSYAEVTNCGDVDANDADIYGLDRDAAASWADAYVDENANVDRDLTDEMIRTGLRTVKQQGGNTTVIVTGYDTYAKIQGLYEPSVRYMPIGEATAKVGVNGIQTEAGLGFGVNVATLYGIPLILSKDTVKDTISRIYFLDTSDPEGFGKPRLGIDVAKPTQYFEAGMYASNKDPFGIDRLGTEGMYRTMAELKCRFFKAQGKIRDLK